MGKHDNGYGLEDNPGEIMIIDGQASEDFILRINNQIADGWKIKSTHTNVVNILEATGHKPVQAIYYSFIMEKVL